MTVYQKGQNQNKNGNTDRRKTNTQSIDKGFGGAFIDPLEID